MDRISGDFYILSWVQNSHVRYAPLYIHSFVLCAPRKILEATQFNQRYRRYEEIENVPDRLRWLRHSRGLMQKEAAMIAGVTRTVYINIECGITQRIPLTVTDKLAAYYGKLREDFLDEFNRFLLDGQAERIQESRTKTGLTRREYAKQMGIPIRSLEVWETEQKAISYKCWEKYFEGKA